VTTDVLSPFEAGGRWWAVEFPDHTGLVTDIAALIDEVRASRLIVESAVEVDAAYPEEFGPEVWDAEPTYRWKRAMHALHAGLAGSEALKKSS
jgi:hypothetical protein